MKTTGLAKAFAGGIASRVFTAGLQFLCAPLFLHLLGKESYGVVGFYYTLVAASNIVDFGLSATINREIAKRRADPDKHDEIQSVVYSLECVYLTLSLVVTVVMFLIAPYLAQHYLNRQFISQSTLDSAMRIVALAVGVQFPLTFYQGVFLGHERQGTVNLVTAVFGIPRIVGAAILLVFFTHSVVVFLWFQAIVSALQVALYVYMTWNSTGLHRRKSEFRADLLRGCAGFMGGAGTISLMSSFLTQVDKLLVPKLLNLGEAGLYSLATAPTVAISMIGLAVSSTFFPRLARLIAEGNDEKINLLYHRAAHGVAVAIGTSALTIVLLAHQFLWAWTGRADYATQLQTALQLLAVAALMNGLLVLPWTLMMASNLMAIGIWATAAGGVAVVPLIIILTKMNGLVGPPEAWTIVNFALLLVGATLMHRKVLHGQMARWAVLDSAIPLLTMAGTGYVVATLLNFFMNGSRTLVFVEIAIVAAVIAVAGTLAGPIRPYALGKCRSVLIKAAG